MPFWPVSHTVVFFVRSGAHILFAEVDGPTMYCITKASSMLLFSRWTNKPFYADTDA